MDNIIVIPIVWKPLGQFDIAMLRLAEGPSENHVPSGTKVIGHVDLVIDLPTAPL